MRAAETFRDNEAVQDLLSSFIGGEQKLVGIICASLIALLPRQLCRDYRLTSHSCVRDAMVKGKQY